MGRAGTTGGIEIGGLTGAEVGERLPARALGRRHRWVRVVVGLAVGGLIGLGIAAVYARVDAGSDPEMPPQDRQLLTLVNQVRVRWGCPPLAPDATLNSLATADAQDMATRGRLDTVDPQNQDPTVRARRLGYQGLVTEHFAAGLDTPVEVISLWSIGTPASAPIRQDLRTCSLVSVGIGHDSGTVLPTLGAQVWVISLGDR
jgi:Cysteine-rich secretory protein family